MRTNALRLLFIIAAKYNEFAKYVSYETGGYVMALYFKTMAVLPTVCKPVIRNDFVIILMRYQQRCVSSFITQTRVKKIDRYITVDMRVI
jgi:hypothetical protein